MKILVITLTNVGDVILTTPVLTSLWRAYPQARLTVLAGPRAAGLFGEGTDRLDVMVYDKRAGWRRKWELLRRLRARRFDRVVDLRRTLWPVLLGAWRDVFSLFPARPRSPYQADRHLAVVERLGIEPAAAFYVPVSDRDERRADELLKACGADLKRIVAMAPGARSRAKRWRQEGFDATARILVRGGASVLWVGDGSDRSVVDELMRRAPDGWASLCGRTTLGELAAVLKRCRALVTNDSAPMHLACALGIGTVSIFGPTDADRYAPRGRGHRVLKLACFHAPEPGGDRPPASLDREVARVCAAAEDIVSLP